MALAICLALPAGAFAAGPLDPVTTITGGPSGTTAVRAPTFTFSSPDTGSFQCQVDGGEWAACSSPFTTQTLSFATHTFEVRGVGLLGLTFGSPAARSFRVADTTPPVDTTPPDTTISGGPANKSTVKTSDVAFEFTSNEAGSTFGCPIHSFQGAYSACASPITLPGLTEGSHTFLVRAVDPAGNKDQTPANREFVVDARPDGPMCLGKAVTMSAPRVTM